ncbi:hypothetical protein Ahy_A09g041495 isoform C [Arachis hypogaea]|nr:hypothetical protein Ahy_A09g041495 isoform C [Arachis hypogaea]
MDFSSRDINEDSILRCPFLRNINEPTNFSFSSPLAFSMPVREAKGPIFEDGPNFDLAFRLFHGSDGVVPLSERSFRRTEKVKPEAPSSQFNPLAAKAATISLSSFGFGGAFGFDAFSEKWNNQKRKSKSSKKEPSSQDGSHHEATGNDWLQNGNCPIAKSYRAVSNVLPLVAKVVQLPPGMKYKCPPAVVAARAALARTAFAKNLRPQSLPTKVLAIGMLGMAANVPLGVWREHTKKFSPSWFAAVHAAVPFIAMLRKSVLMPKSAMAFTIAASVLGQVIGSRAERYRLKAIAARKLSIPDTSDVASTSASASASALASASASDKLQIVKTKERHCGETMDWNAVSLQLAGSSSTDLADKKNKMSLFAFVPNFGAFQGINIQHNATTELIIVYLDLYAFSIDSLSMLIYNCELARWISSECESLQSCLLVLTILFSNDEISERDEESNKRHVHQWQRTLHRRANSDVPGLNSTTASFTTTVDTDTVLLQQVQEFSSITRITVDESVVTDPDAVLRVGSKLVYHRLPWKEPDAPYILEVLYEDDDMIALNKPSGLQVLPGGLFQQRTVLTQLKWEANKQSTVKAHQRLHFVPVHRLGRGTSGLLLCAKTKLAKARLASYFADGTSQIGGKRDTNKEHGKIAKIYRALVSGIVDNDKVIINQPIGIVKYPDVATGLYVASESGKPALSIVNVLERGVQGNNTLVQVQIESGRPHQIRIHLSFIGHPLLGDPLYAVGGQPKCLDCDVINERFAADGGYERPTKPVPGDCGYYLHAHQLIISHPVTNEVIEIIAPLPSILQTKS